MNLLVYSYYLLQACIKWFYCTSLCSKLLTFFNQLCIQYIVSCALRKNHQPHLQPNNILMTKSHAYNIKIKYKCINVNRWIKYNICINVSMYTAILRKVVRKSAHDNPERYCGWFGVHCFSKNFERLAWAAVEVCLRVLKKSNKSKFDSYSVRNSVLIISHTTFWDCHMHIFFPTTFLEIAINDLVFLC